MGRLALFLVAAAVVAAGAFSVGSDSASRHVGALEDAQEGSMARQAARSALAIAERHLRDAMENGGAAALDQTGVPIEDGAFGEYDVLVADADTAYTINVTGRFGDAEHSFSAYYQESFDLPGALMVYTGDASPEVKEDAVLTGWVTRPPSIPAAGWSAKGKKAIAGLAVSPRIEAEYQSELSADEWARVTGAKQVSTASPPYWMRDVVAEIKSHPSLVTYDKLKLNGNKVLGSPDNPAFVRITDEMFINNNARGYGVILVQDGHLWMNDQGSWEGLVIIEGTQSGSKIELDIEDTNAIYGAVLMFGGQAGSQTWEYGDAEVELWDASQIYWSPDALERLIPDLPSLGKGYDIGREFDESQ